MSSGPRSGLKAFAGAQANAGSAALVYQAATGRELAAEGGSEDTEDSLGYYDVVTGCPSLPRSVRRLRRDELLFKMQDAAIRDLPEQLARLLSLEGTPSWPVTQSQTQQGVMLPLLRRDLLEARDARGRTLLWLAVESSNADPSARNGVAVIELLASRGADVDAIAPIREGPDDGDGEMAAAEGIRPGQDPHGRLPQPCGTAFMLATRNNKTALMRALQELGADVQRPDESGRTPLCVAAASNHNATLQLLLSMGVDLEVSINNPQHKVLIFQENRVLIYDCVIRLQRPDRWGRTPLTTACARGNMYAAGALVEAGARLMPRDHRGAPPFFRCCEFGHSWMLGELFERWWPATEWINQLKTVDSGGRCLAHVAAEGEPDCLTTVWELAGGGAAAQDLLMSRDSSGLTPLNYACSSMARTSFYHKKYGDRAVLRIVQMLVNLCDYPRASLLDDIRQLITTDRNMWQQCPLLGRELYEAAEVHGAPEPDPERLATIWGELEEDMDIRGQRPPPAVLPLSPRQAIRQHLEMAAAVPRQTRARLLCHQRLAWASATHGRVGASAESLSPDLVEQVAASFAPECKEVRRIQQ